MQLFAERLFFVGNDRLELGGRQVDEDGLLRFPPLPLASVAPSSAMEPRVRRVA